MERKSTSSVSIQTAVVVRASPHFQPTQPIRTKITEKTQVRPMRKNVANVALSVRFSRKSVAMPVFLTKKEKFRGIERSSIFFAREKSSPSRW